MACRGMFYALTNDQSSFLLRSRNVEETMMVVNQIGESFDDEFSLFVDKAWDAIHRCLTDGTLGSEAGPYPLCKCVLGGVSIHSNDEYIICYVSSRETSDVAAAVADISKEWFQNRYVTLDFPDYQYGEKNDDDFEYTWEHFEQLISFYQRAAFAKKSVIFTVDQ